MTGEVSIAALTDSVQKFIRERLHVHTACGWATAYTRRVPLRRQRTNWPPPDDEPERLPAAWKETDFRMRMSPPRGTHRVGEQ
ncbi:MAG TPA: hypothetical protein VJS67_09060 [Pseudonocardiaceae bacterium]|nr:hypothetical protein [Pseudonocardiaceae bacterium]